MYAIVKFKGQQEPVLFGISNAGHAHRLSTMHGVEWVSSAVLTHSGALASEDKGKVTSSSLSQVVIKAWQPGDPDPLGRFREQPSGE